MPSEPPDRRVRFSNLNWLGKSVYVGASVLRVAAKAIDRTADRVNRIAEESREAYLREVDPNIEDAKVIEETPREHRSSP
ncbi:hypothetical protein [Longibacter sp.]|jgi:hypothetical protein|uniref:hypothetical protein n=1 Tax=Longibacter sp. TaxID=2045415 RepID=UPI003EBF301D